MTTYTLDTRTATPHFPGIGRYVRSLAAHLPAHLQDDESLVLITQPDAPMADVLDPKRPWRVTTVSAASSPFSMKQQWAVPRLLRRLSAARGPHVLYHSPYYVMPYATPCPTVLTLYDTIALTYPDTVSPRARNLFRMTTNLALHAANHIITISNAARSDFAEQFSIDPASVSTVPLAAGDEFHPRSAVEQQRLRAKTGLPDNYLLYVGSNKPHKNLVRLIDAYAQLHAAGPAQTQSVPALVIAGAWNPHYPQPKQRAAEYRLGDAICFLGPIDDADLPALYSAATAFVFPSLCEGFGLPVLEAMACGTPVACSHASSLPEVAGDAVYYFDPHEVASIYRAMQALVADAPLRARLRKLGQRRKKRFSWDRTAAETLAVYRSVMKQERVK